MGVDGCAEVVPKINVAKFHAGSGPGCLAVYLCAGPKPEPGVTPYGNLKTEVIIGKTAEEVTD